MDEQFSRNLRRSERNRGRSDRNRRGDRRSHSPPPPPRRQRDSGWKERDYPKRERSPENRRRNRKQDSERQERRERGSSSNSSQAAESSYEEMDNRRRSHKRRRPRSGSRHSEETDNNRRRDSEESSSKKRRRKRRKRRNRRRRRRSESSDSRTSSEATAGESKRNVVVSDSNDEEYSAKAFRTKRSSAKKEKPRSASKDRDDTVGHFEGGNGTVIADRYKILRQVGLGTFGRVVECLDLKRHLRRDKNAFVALKIVRNVKRYHESAIVESSIIHEVNRRGGRGQTHCVVLHDSFSFRGHYCMVFESLGPSLYEFMKRHNYQPFPMACVQDFTVQLLETLEFLHGNCRLIHTDLKIENILLMNDREVNYGNRRVPESTKIKLIDFGGSCYDSEKKSSVIQTRQYRSPEVILGTGWDMSSDMWSLGCILAELYRGELLFATHDNIEHLALMERIIGRFPRRMLAKVVANGGQQSELVKQAFDSSGWHRLDRVLPADKAFFVTTSPRLEKIIENRDDGWFLDLLRMILVLDPTERATAHECLQFLSRIRKYVVRYN